MHKDIGLALDSGQEQGVPLPITSLTRQMFQAAISEGYGDLDMCSTIQVMERWAGIQVKKH
jgi:3-hydroxyisobutyrate dehydrogenase/2-hydroxy-3-oxopropionate reductase